MEYSEMRGTEIKIKTYVSDKELTSQKISQRKYIHLRAQRQKEGNT